MKKQKIEYQKIREGDIVFFYYKDAKNNKYTVSIEILKIRKDSFAGVLMTSKKFNLLYPGDYILPDGIMPQKTKIICDQIVKIDKEKIISVYGNVGTKILKEIRQKVIESLMNIRINI